MQRPTTVLINTITFPRLPSSFIAILFFSSNLSIAHPDLNFKWGDFGGNRGRGGFGGNGCQGAFGGNSGQGAFGGNGGQGAVVAMAARVLVAMAARVLLLGMVARMLLVEIVADLSDYYQNFINIHGCDASVLLDDTTTISSEKQSGPNKNSLRGFEVVDKIKAKLEEACPEVVSCADILALAARGSTVLKHSCTEFYPPKPHNLLQSSRSQQGSHTIGVAKCVSFRQRLYNQNGNNQPDETLERNYYQGLKSVCPESGGDNIISPLDLASPVKFDNTYFKLLLWGRGLLNSDEVLMTGKGGNWLEGMQKMKASYSSSLLNQWLKWEILVHSQVIMGKSERTVDE
ncbi:Peroxidase [Thalictrum thalictroides]|uniref:Peroxidase n=1 Tax=Thalictrum thalictroides TaxID=46969 RepID=A0A7J6VHW6_THATH|nr:Peroxidase [Thalictrum thalictroides]